MLAEAPDFVLCTDLGIEVGDFVITDSRRVVFVHAKASLNTHRCPANTLYEVASPGIKNLHHPQPLSIAPMNHRQCMRPWSARAHVEGQTYRQRPQCIRAERRHVEAHLFSRPITRHRSGSVVCARQCLFKTPPRGPARHDAAGTGGDSGLLAAASDLGSGLPPRTAATNLLLAVEVHMRGPTERDANDPSRGRSQKRPAEIGRRCQLQ
jgi:hypothetical protein